MKLYTFYTDSHAILFNNFFKSSLSKIPNIDLIERKIEQKCPTASYMNDGWLQTMKFKVDLHIEASKQYDDQIFIYSDCDVIFLDTNLVEQLLFELEDNDMAFQNDVEPWNNRQTCCAGFFISRANEKTTKLWEKVAKTLNELPQHSRDNDQTLLNSALDSKEYGVKYKLLSNKFFTLAQYNKKIWDENTDPFDFDIPQDIVTYHANWTHGVSNKITLLKLVQEKKH